MNQADVMNGSFGQPYPPQFGNGTKGGHRSGQKQQFDEPICVLKIELDGENVEEIKVFENDDPR